jgi:hypothetical protein
MKIKVRDLPDDLFEYEADVVPRKDEFIFHKDQRYKISYVCHYVEEAEQAGGLGEAYVVVEVSTTHSYLLGS